MAGWFGVAPQWFEYLPAEPRRLGYIARPFRPGPSPTLLHFASPQWFFTNCSFDNSFTNRLWRGIQRFYPIKRIGHQANSAVVVADVFNGVGEVEFAEDKDWELTSGPK